jgi:hypothetical protein
MKRLLAVMLTGVLMVIRTAWLPAQATFDHGRFDRALAAHVTDGRVDYAAFAASREFTAYLGMLSSFDPSRLERDERLAFWINAYNAFTIELINRNEERRSIRKISRPWSTRFIRIGGRTLSLDDIEHEIVRKEFREPRIHFALVCAAKGCPPLRSEAYTGPMLERQLDDQTVTFLTRTPGKNWVDVATGTVWLSPIFKFRDYEKDFGGSREAIGRFVAGYFRRAGLRAEAEVLERGRFALKYTDYDWSLNGRAND